MGQSVRIQTRWHAGQQEKGPLVDHYQLPTVGRRGVDAAQVR